LKQRNEIKDHIKKEDDDNEDVESVNSEEFNDMLDHMGNNQDLDDLDIAADIIPIKKKGNITFFCIKASLINTFVEKK
jgi:hypothetical protein